MVLILGSNGYCGSYFKKLQNHPQYPLIKCYDGETLRFPIDEKKFATYLLENNITRVINCLGVTGKPNVDACEEENSKLNVLQGNVLLVQQLCNVCIKYGVKFVQISSGCLYRDLGCELGVDPMMEFTEEDEPNFCFGKKASWYSGTKKLCEDILKPHFDQILVARLRIPFGSDLSEKNYINKILKYDTLLNATNSFSNIEEFAQAVYYLSKEHTGIFNIVQPGYMSTKQIIHLINRENFNKSPKFFNNIDEFNKTVKAPRSNCVLSPVKALRAGCKLTPIQQSFEQAIQQIKNAKKN